MADEVIIKDSLDHSIYLPPYFLSGPGKGMLEKITATVSKPALLVESLEEGEKQLNYFRSVDWHETLLFVARRAQGQWEAFRCLRNPSSELLAEILRNGKQLV